MYIYMYIYIVHTQLLNYIFILSFVENLWVFSEKLRMKRILRKIKMNQATFSNERMLDDDFIFISVAFFFIRC